MWLLEGNRLNHPRYDLSRTGTRVAGIQSVSGRTKIRTWDLIVISDAL